MADKTVKTWVKNGSRLKGKKILSDMPVRTRRTLLILKSSVGGVSIVILLSFLFVCIFFMQHLEKTSLVRVGFLSDAVQYLGQ